VFTPEKNTVVAVASKDGDVDNAEAAAWRVIRNSAKQTNEGADPPRREPVQAED